MVRITPTVGIIYAPEMESRKLAALTNDQMLQGNGISEFAEDFVQRISSREINKKVMRRDINKAEMPEASHVTPEKQHRGKAF
ncbi:hypothetical protein P5673_013653 [Acropora cervicornis]|uniref:Uncharacterized protein n=1 Tax=Acropora cervicornis TaxID=6130 RepID=A0AAD9QLR6_ACRCE|nr:hypothetical protein P5673_013653 [Acropora cervicornis]